MGINLLIGDNFFKQNPSKVLGEQQTVKGRFGNDRIVVNGGIDQIEKIDAEPAPIIDLYPTQVLTTETEQEIIQQVFEKEAAKDTEKKIKRLRNAGKKETAPDNRQVQDVYTFDEVNRIFNADISRDELEAYYYTHPELNYKIFFEKFQNSKDDLIKKGLICIEARNAMAYLYTYQSGNIGKKVSELKQNASAIIEKYGQLQYDRQLDLLNAVRPKMKGFIGDEKIVLLPHSNFAKEIRIKELRLGKPELYGDTTLIDAFKMWLRDIPPQDFKIATSREVIDFYLDNKSMPIDRNSSKEYQAKQEKININTKQRTKEEGDEKFADFLAKELLPEDQARISFDWNNKFNSVAEPNLTKIPVCFRISKTWKNHAPLRPNDTQRQAAAFTQEKKSGLLAYQVGVGKTLSSIMALSQAFENKFAKYFLYVVPTNTFDNWIGEIQGYKDKKTGVFMEGVLPHFPQVQGLFNLNPTIVKEKLKIYSQSDELQLQSILDAVMFLQKSKEDEITKDQKIAINAIYKINFLGIESEYQQYIANTKSVRPKTPREYVIDYLRDEYNYWIYELGTIREFPVGTIFVITEVGVQRLGVGENNKEKLTSKLFEILSQGEKAADKESKRDIAGLQLKIQQTVASSLKNAKLKLEDLKIDWACFDESHYYKKLFTFVKGETTGEEKEDRKGNIKAEREKSKYEIKSGAYPSSRALSAFVVSHYIQETNDNRNIIHLTATPFTNSPLEVFSMLTLTNYKALEEMNVSNMVTFFDTFMKINYDIKYTPQKTVVKDVVLTGYNNLPQLRQIIYSLMDKKDAGANLIRPDKIMYPSMVEGRETTLPMTAQQETMMRSVKAYISGDLSYESICQEAQRDEIDNFDFDAWDDETLIMEWERLLDKEYTGSREDIGDDNREKLIKAIKSAKQKGIELNEEDLSEDESLGVRILVGLSMMRQITLSPYLYTDACGRAQGINVNMPTPEEYIGTSPKLKYVMGCVKSQIDFHRERREKISGQVIYMNAGIKFFPVIKDYIVKYMGISASQVGIVSGGMSKGAKENVKKGFLNGDILVLIGSSTISVGVNLQDNATTLYNCYYDWNPTDAAQIEGRIWRQGNRFAYVRINYPQVFNSADPVIFEYLNSKTLRINEIWNRSSEVQELDLRDFNPKELQKKLITDPEEKADWEILEESDKIHNQVIYFENRRDSINDAYYAFGEVKKLKPIVIGYLEKLINAKSAYQRKEALTNQKEKIAELAEKYAEDPAKMSSEINNYKKSRYDYANDPDKKYAPITLTDTSNDELYSLCAKWYDNIQEWEYRKDYPIYEEMYYDSSSIGRTLRDFRNNFKDMRSSEERILIPLGLTFDDSSKANPMVEFDRKLVELKDQLDAIESKEARDKRIANIKREMSAKGNEQKSVGDRIKEWSDANEKYLIKQLEIPVLQTEKPEPEKIINPISETKLAAQDVYITPPAIVEKLLAPKTPNRDLWKQWIAGLDDKNKRTDIENLAIGDYAAVPQSAKSSGAKGFIIKVGPKNIVMKSPYQMGTVGIDDIELLDLTFPKSDVMAFYSPKSAAAPVQNIVMIPGEMANEIKHSVKLGFDKLAEGMISPKRKGVMLINEDAEVRGTYDLKLKDAIQEIIDNEKAKAVEVHKPAEVEIPIPAKVDKVISATGEGAAGKEEPKKVITKEDIKSQINALNLAKKFADKNDKANIEAQVKALTISLKFM